MVKAYAYCLAALLTTHFVASIIYMVVGIQYWSVDLRFQAMSFFLANQTSLINTAVGAKVALFGKPFKIFGCFFALYATTLNLI